MKTSQNKPLIFPNTMELFFSNCATRINNEIITQGKTAKDLYSDEKLVSRIRHNRRSDKQNRYLLTDTFIQEALIKSKLFNSKFDVLWGNEKEITETAFSIFYRIFLDMYSSELKDKYVPITDQVLIDYAPYARSLTYHDILKEQNIAHDDLSYGVIPDEIFSDLPSSRFLAISFLYKKCQFEFLKIFLDFTHNTTSFFKIDSIFKNNFIDTKFIELIKKYMPTSDSLGLRVQQLIISDISHSKDLIAEYPSTNETTALRRELVYLSSEYVFKIMKLQEKYLSLYLPNHSN